MRMSGGRAWALALAVFAALVMQVSHADTVMITGANSGLGLELARQYGKAGWMVIAVHRRDSTPKELADLAKQYPAVRPERMDVTSEAEVRALASKLKGVTIDVLINNAANTSTGEKQHFGQLDFDEGADVRVMVDIIAGSLIRTIAGLSMADTGHFIQYDGKALAW